MGRGKLVRYEHGGFDRNQEEECVMELQSGSVIDKQFYHNHKKEGISMLNAAREMQKSFPIERFPELKGKMIFVVLRGIEVSPDGSILACRDLKVYFPREKTSLTDLNHPLLKAVQEELHRIYPMEVYYINGEYRLEYTNYSFLLQRGGVSPAAVDQSSLMPVQ